MGMALPMLKHPHPVLVGKLGKYIPVSELSQDQDMYQSLVVSILTCQFVCIILVTLPNLTSCQIKMLNIKYYNIIIL